MIKHLLGVAIIAALCIAPSVAEAHPTKYVPLTLQVAIQSEATRPMPSHYDPDVVGYPKNIAVYSLPHKRVWELCRNNRSYGCVFGNDPGGRYTGIIIDSALSGKVRHIVLRHEYAHILGWQEP